MPIKSHIKNKCWRQGIYQPVNMNKYKGSKLPTFLSAWEYRFMRYIDLSDSVLEWTSEEPTIPYLNPNTNTVWNYHPDMLIKVKTQVGIKIQMIEIKPKKQTMPPTAGNKKKSTILKEATTWRLNQAKWIAAKSYCLNKGWEFKILTEDDLFS